MKTDLTPKQEFIVALAKEFPSASNKSLGRMAFKRAPELFSSAEEARINIVRARTGNNGPRKVKVVLPLNSYSVGSAFAKLPDGKTDFEDWDSVPVLGERVLILSDCHIPYHDRPALLAAIQYGKKANADAVILNGDISDFFAVSSWEKDPRKRNFKLELETVREFLSALRKAFPHARIIYKLGNHEERLERYMRVRAPELLGVEAMDIDSLLDFKSQGIELVGDKRPMRVGQLNVIHGHEYRFAISNPVNPARGFFLRCKAYVIGGHFHQISSHSARTVEGRNMSAWSTGCLCELHPEYRPLNDWNHGFAFVEVFSNGKFEVQNKFIGKNGKVY